jgi:subfamily B ATP-binding cassette protein MsbA
MDENLKKIIPFALKYKKDIVMNVIYNILYALFSTLSFIALIPMLDVLFKDAEKIVEEPKLTSIWEITSYGNDYLYFYIKLHNVYLKLTVIILASVFISQPYF